MTIFIGHISALQFLLASRQPSRNVLGQRHYTNLKVTKAAPPAKTIPNHREVSELGLPEGIATGKLHVNVADRESRSRSKSLVCHVWPAPPTGSYLRVDNTYCVMTPEACFAQLADTLPLAHLVELAMMLCGTYSPSPYGNPTLYDVRPLTTPRKLTAYLERLNGKRGLDKARIAARLATPGAGSPMEAKIATILALSTRQGGMGMPALLNAEIELTDEARGRGYRAIRRPDFLWPQYNVAMDYDSNEYHDLKEAAVKDEQRRNELAAMGLTSIVARTHHFREFTDFEALMGQLEAAMHKTHKSTARNLSEKRGNLFRQLFTEMGAFKPMRTQ